MEQGPKVLGTGLSGLVGKRILELLSPQYEFEDISQSGIDITDEKAIKDIISSSDSNVILHLAAKTDVDSAEDDKILGEDGLVWRINVEGTGNIVNAARLTGKRLIYISTDFVFDGSKEYFTEEDEPNPVNWYGETKYQGELLIQESTLDYTILRISSPYCRLNYKKKDFVHRIIDRLEKKENIFGVTDHYFTPTYIDDIAEALRVFLSRSLTGIYHLGGGERLSPFSASTLIAKTLNFDSKLIIPTTRDVFFKGRAFRPRNYALKNDKISKFGIKMRTFSEGLKEFKK